MAANADATKNGTKYQYKVYAVNSDGKSKASTTKTVTVKGNKNLTKGKKYYIRMRAYKTSGSVTSYAGWSKVKTVTVKK